MSVLIKGMEMPKSCDKCELMTANYGCAFVGAVGGESYRKRAWDCPLVEVPEPMKWIPVTERLPDESGSYLIVDSGHVTEAYYGKEWAGDNWTDPVEMYMTFHPTHWMPLPPPPKDGES